MMKKASKQGKNRFIKVRRHFSVGILAWGLYDHFGPGVPCRFTQTVPRLTNGSSPSEIWVRSR